MIDQDKKIRKGMGRRRDIAAFQTQHDIVIPAGTMMREIGEHEYAAGVGLAPGFAATLSVTIKPGAVVPASLKRVIAS